VWYGRISDRTCIIDTAIDQYRKHLQACVRANDGHLNTFCNKLLQTICIFHVFLVQMASIHRACQIVTVLMLDGRYIGLLCLTADVHGKIVK